MIGSIMNLLAIIIIFIALAAAGAVIYAAWELSSDKPAVRKRAAGDAAVSREDDGNGAPPDN
jgi:flagellar basal body-associated protein FliL